MAMAPMEPTATARTAKKTATVLTEPTTTKPMATGPMATTPTARTAMEPTVRTATPPTGLTATATGPTATKPGFPHLESLVGAQASAGFLATAFGKDAYRTRVSQDWARALFGWPTLNQVLAEHRLAPPRLKREKHGKQVGGSVFRGRRTRRGEALKDIDVAALYAQLREGATLILDAVNELSPPLQRLCAGLADEFSS